MEVVVVVVVEVAVVEEDMAVVEVAVDMEAAAVADTEGEVVVAIGGRVAFALLDLHCRFLSLRLLTKL